MILVDRNHFCRHTAHHHIAFNILNNYCIGANNAIVSKLNVTQYLGPCCNTHAVP